MRPPLWRRLQWWHWAIVGVLLLIAVAAFPTSGPSRDSNTDTFSIRFQNDLGRPVWLALCKSDHSARCEHPEYRETIGAGGSLSENVETDVRTEWAIETKPSGGLDRCVLLDFRRYPGREPRIRLSSTPGWSNPCPQADWY